MKSPEKHPELVVCAAIKLFNITDPSIEIIIPSIRHYDQTFRLIKENMEYDEWRKKEQGFFNQFQSFCR